MEYMTINRQDKFNERQLEDTQYSGDAGGLGVRAEGERGLEVVEEGVLGVVEYYGRDGGWRRERERICRASHT